MKILKVDKYNDVMKEHGTDVFLTGKTTITFCCKSEDQVMDVVKTIREIHDTPEYEENGKYTEIIISGNTVKLRVSNSGKGKATFNIHKFTRRFNLIFEAAAFNAFPKAVTAGSLQSWLCLFFAEKGIDFKRISITECVVLDNELEK